jgi:hypothetical protein
MMSGEMTGAPSSCDGLTRRIAQRQHNRAASQSELERYMRCRQCSEVRRYPYKRSQLVALRPTKITANDPPSTWWPGER